MLFCLIASFFYSDIIYRLPVGSYGHFFLSDIVGVGFVCYVILRKCLGWKVSKNSNPKLLYVLVATFVWMLISLACLCFTSDKPNFFSRFGRACFDTYHFFEYLLITYAVLKYPIDDKSEVKKYFYFIVCLGVLVASIGIVIDLVLHVSRYYHGITANILRPKRELTAFFTTNRGSAGLFFYTCAAISISLLVSSQNVIQRMFLLFASTLLVVSVILTTSRSSILAMLIYSIAFLVLFYIYSRFNLKALLISTLLIIVFVSVSCIALRQRAVMSRISSTFEVLERKGKAWNTGAAGVAVVSRFDNWKKGIDRSTKSITSFLKGYGVHQEGFLTGYSSAHNNYLQFLVDLGVVGLLLFLTLLYQSLAITVNGIRCKDSETSIFSLGMLAYVLGVSVACFTMEALYTMPGMGNFMPFYLILLVITDKFVFLSDSGNRGKRSNEVTLDK